MKRYSNEQCNVEEAASVLGAADSIEMLVRGEEEAQNFVEYVVKRGSEPIAVVLVDVARGEIPQARIRCGEGWLIYGLIPHRSRDSVPFVEYSWLFIDSAGRQRSLDLRSEEVAAITRALKRVVEKILQG